MGRLAKFLRERALQLRAPSLWITSVVLAPDWQGRFRGWIRRGLPDELFEDEPSLGEFITLVYGRLSFWDEPEQRGARLKRLAYTGLLDKKDLRRDEPQEYLQELDTKEPAALGAWLKGWIERETAHRKACGEKKFDVASELAVELGIAGKAVRSWARRQKVPREFYRMIDQRRRWDAHEKMLTEGDRVLFLELMELARKPAKYQEKRTVRKRRNGQIIETVETVELDEPVTPTFRSSSALWQGDAVSGWRWGLRIGEFLSPAVVLRMLHFARSVKPTLPRKMPFWRVTAIGSWLNRGRGKKSPYRGGHIGSGKKVRKDLSESHPHDGNNFVVEEGYTSGAYTSRSFAIEQFRKRMCAGLEQKDLIYIHGVIVYNFRKRDPREFAAQIEMRQLRQQAVNNRRKRLEAVKEAKAQKLVDEARHQQELYEWRTNLRAKKPGSGSKQTKKRPGKRPRR